MAQSWIVTLHPCIHHRFKTEYQEASDSIISIEELMRKYHHSEQSKNTPESILEQYVEHLMSKKISPQDFRRAVEKNHFLLKQEFYLEVAAAYEAYGHVAVSNLHKWVGGVEGEAPSPRPQRTRGRMMESVLRRQDPEDCVKQIMVLAHKLSEPQEDFLDALAKVSEVKKISVLSGESNPSPLTVWEAPTQETEISTIAQEIKKLLKKRKKAISLSSIYIFSCDLERQKADFKIIFNREQIPYSFWNGVGETIQCVSILPFDSNTIVFGEMNTVFVSGASSFPKERFLMTEDEKNYFNQALGKGVFKTQAESKEETKGLLSFLMDHSQKLILSYTYHLSLPFKEFLEERTRASFKKLSFLSELAEWAKSEITFPSLKPLSSLLLKQKKEIILPKIYSIRALTQYERCPYGFLLKECLHLSPEKKITSELSYAEEGELVHYILFRYFTKQESLEKLCEEACLVISDKFKKEIIYPDRLRIEKEVGRFLQVEKEWQAKSRFTPKFFELPFENFSLSWRGKTIQLRGKIDRVDIDEKTKEFKVIDYKTGSQAPKGFQLQLYAMAMESLFLTGYHAAEGIFYMLKNSEIKKGFECPTSPHWQGEKEKTLEKVFAFIDQIESLSFPATPHACYDSCETKNVCEHTENI